MMNVLTDILPDTSPLLISQSYKDTLTQSKLISSHDVSTKQGHLHLLDSVPQISHIDRPLSNINNSSPSSIDIFNASSQILIPSNMDSGFDDRSQVSVFSDQFPEIVPSWLTHDFMKVSDNLPSPGILSNVSDIYPSSRENEHLEMLDLGFPHELTSQDVSTNLNRCIDAGQKLLEEMAMQRFSANESLMIPPFNDIHSNQLPLSMSKNGMQYQKFKPNAQHFQASTSLMNSVMPCENELVHLPLPSTLAEQCLNSTSSPSIIPNSQSQTHPVNVVCDKLPQISLTHLDSLLDNETTLSDIHLLRHDFPHVNVHQESQQINNCTHQTNDSCMTGCNSSRIISCETGNFLGSQMAPIPQHQDVSIQVPENGSGISLGSSSNQKCFSCSQVPLESALEKISCFKCKFCDFINIHKCAVASHINISHSKSTDSSSCIVQDGTNNIHRSDEILLLNDGGVSEARLAHSEILVSNTLPTPINSAVVNIVSSEKEPMKSMSNNFQCLKCSSVFSDINVYNSHLLMNHNIQPENVPSNVAEVTIYCQPIPSNGILLNPSTETLVTTINEASRSNAITLQNELKNNLKETTMKRKIFPKKVDDSLKKNSPKKTGSNESLIINSEKQISSHKKAWQKKMKRELGSYICEFKGCNVRFRALDNLEYHKKCHIGGVSSFACPECNISFEKWGPIAGHLWREHGNDMELHACDQCQFRTYSLSRLENTHKRIHKNEYLFLCDTCGKSFKSRKQLLNHRAIHSKKRKAKNIEGYKCDICSGLFSTKRARRIHQASVHDKVKRFFCDFCDYMAFKHAGLKMHMRVHTGEKPFECDKCQYKTSDHNSLRRHKQKHSGEKPYKCPYCSYSSIQASSYKSHLKKHPGQNGLMFSCSICPFRTVKQESLVIHMSEHENSKRPQNDSSINEMNSADDIFPMAKALHMKSFSWCS